MGVVSASLLASASLVNFASVEIPLSHLFNNQAASIDGSGADFDRLGSSFDAQLLPKGQLTYAGIKYTLPASWGQGPDNILATGQVINLPNAIPIHELHFIYAGDGDSTSLKQRFNFTFADNSTESVQLVGKNWWTWPYVSTGIIKTPYHFINGSSNKDTNITEIFQWSTSISSKSALTSITLPSTNTSSSRVHIFALSVTPAADAPGQTLAPVLAIKDAAFSTSRWEDVNDTRAQAVQVTLANVLPQSAGLSTNTSISSAHSIEISGPDITTISAGVVNRLIASDQARVDVLIFGGRSGTDATILVKDSNGRVIGTSDGWPVTPLRETWTADQDELWTHETPTWWNKAKFGIFIHWGVYSVPAWAPSGQYAEWYDWDQHIPDNPTYAYHEKTYGKDFVYDDFIANFTASKFNASSWLDLFDNAGAKYFVSVTKHHDGFALFDTGNTTGRSSVRLGPKRDLLAELFETAQQEKPEIHRGTYYSLPGMYNPDYAKYGFSSWPGGLAHNAYNSSEIEPYTGRINISDYLEDLQLPHMLTLAEKYGSEIMWCDIGGPNKMLDFSAAYYNNALAKGLQVTVNNRCGAVPDFDTPEYATYSSVQTRKWETSEGMDPYSYGLNKATNASEYKNGTTIIQTLVDIVAKNGNYLLDIGPTAEGEIIAPMANNLLDAGEWLKYAGDCVYSTDYWYQTSQNSEPEDTPVRFLTTPNTFCIVALSKPGNGQLVVSERLPVLPGDEIFLLGPHNGSSLPWSFNDDATQLTINVSESDLDAVDYAWAFQVRYSGNEL